MLNYSSIILKKTFFDLIQHKIGQRIKILPAFQPLTKCFVFQAIENLSISFNYIRVTSVSQTPASPYFLFRKIVKSISFMENETEEAIKMQKLKKTNSSPFVNRTCLLYWCLKAWLMKTKLRKWNEMRLSQTNKRKCKKLV